MRVVESPGEKRSQRERGDKTKAIVILSLIEMVLALLHIAILFQGVCPKEGGARGNNNEEEEEERTKTCPICDSKYKTTSALNRHIRDKHPDVASFNEQEEEERTIYFCTDCLPKKKFATKHTLARHMGNKHGGAIRRGSVATRKMSPESKRKEEEAKEELEEVSRQYRILVERNKALEADRVKEEERERRRSSFNRLESIAEEPGCSMLSSLEEEHRRDRERQASHRSQRIEHGFESNCQRLRTTKDNVNLNLNLNLQFI